MNCSVLCAQEQDGAGPKVKQDGVAPDQATPAGRGAAKREAQQGGTGAGDADDDDCVIVEGGGAAEGHSGFYRAARETGRANILLVLQARCWDCARLFLCVLLWQVALLCCKRCLQRACWHFFAFLF